MNGMVITGCTVDRISTAILYSISVVVQFRSLLVETWWRSARTEATAMVRIQVTYGYMIGLVATGCSVGKI
jgi:hypothetical protein